METSKAIEILAKELANRDYINILISDKDKNDLMAKINKDNFIRVEDEKGRLEIFGGDICTSLNPEYYQPISENSNMGIDLHIIKCAKQTGSNYLFIDYISGNHINAVAYRYISDKEKKILSNILSPSEISEEIKIALSAFRIELGENWLNSNKKLIEIYKSIDNKGFIGKESAEKLGLRLDEYKSHAVSIEEIYLLDKKKYAFLDTDIYMSIRSDANSRDYNLADSKDKILIKNPEFYYHKELDSEDSCITNNILFKNLLKEKVIAKNPRNWSKKYHLVIGEKGFEYFKTKISFSGEDRIKLLAKVPKQEQNIEANKYLLNGDRYYAEHIYDELIGQYAKNDKFDINFYISYLDPEHITLFDQKFNSYVSHNFVPDDKKRNILDFINKRRNDEFSEIYKKGPEEFDKYFENLEDSEKEEVISHIMKLPEDRRNPESEKLISEKYNSLVGDTVRRRADKNG